MDTSRDGQRRTLRELKTARAMIGIYCRGRHASRRRLCAECAALREVQPLRRVS